MQNLKSNDKQQVVRTDVFKYLQLAKVTVSYTAAVLNFLLKDKEIQEKCVKEFKLNNTWLDISCISRVYITKWSAVIHNMTI